MRISIPGLGSGNPARRVLYPVLTAAVVLSGLLAAPAGSTMPVGDDVRPVASAASTAVADAGAVARVRAAVRAAKAHQPVPGKLRPALSKLRNDRPDLGACDYGKPARRICVHGDPAGDKTLVVLGNSHGRHWIPAFDKIAAEAGWRAIYLVKPQCTAARVKMVRGGASGPWRECVQFNAWTGEQIRKMRPNMVVVSTTGAPAVHVRGTVVRGAAGVSAEISRGFARLFRELKPLTRRVVLLADVPRRDNSPLRCLTRGNVDLGDCLGGLERRANTITRTSVAVAREAHVKVVPTAQWFCHHGRCPAVIGDIVPTRDEGHVTSVYAAELSHPLGRLLGLLPARR